VKVRAKGAGCSVEIGFETPTEVIELAERMLAARLPRATTVP
jgi:hypothetical protein